MALIGPVVGRNESRSRPGVMASGPGAHTISAFVRLARAVLPAALSREEIPMSPERRRGPLDRRGFLCAGGLVLGGLASAEGAAPALLPPGVRAVWDMG